MSSGIMTRAAFMRWVYEQETNNVHGRVVALGFIHWNELRCEVMSTIGETVDCRPGETGFDIACVLSNLGIQNFFYHGRWVLRIDSDATAGPFFL